MSLLLPIKTGVHRLLLRGLDTVRQYQLRNTLTATIVRQRPKEAFPPHWADLAYLGHLISIYRPEVVVELGCGCSTFMIAEALHHSGRGHLYSYESDPHWLEVTRSTMPATLTPHVTLRLAPVEATTHEGLRVWQHRAEWPKTFIDFFYLDSPRFEDGIYVAIDPKLVELHLSPQAVLLVDGRHQNVAWLREHLSGPWRVTRNRLLNNTIFERGY